MRPYLDILRLVWPLALGMANNAVMQFVDRAYLANWSMGALEAVLPASMLCLVVACFFQSVVGYSNVFVAQYHGAGDEDGCHDSYRAALLIAAVSGALTCLFRPAGDLLLEAGSPSPEVLKMEREYFGIVLAGSAFLYGQTACASYFTGLGRTRIVFWVNLLGNALNIALDPLLIFGCGPVPSLGIAGAAYATVAAMAVQFAVLWLAVRRIRFRLPPRRLMLSMLRFGAPSGVYSVLNILSFAIFVFVTGEVGDVELAVSNACFTVNYLLFAPVEGFSLGIQTLVGLARGRNDDSAAGLALKRTVVLAIGFAVVASLSALALHRPILTLFAPDDLAVAAEFHSLGFILFLLMGAWQMFDATDIVICGALKGAGDTKFVMWWMLIGAFVIWLPLVFLVRMLHGSMPWLWATLIVYVVAVCIGSMIRWRHGKWRMIEVLKK